MDRAVSTAADREAADRMSCWKWYICLCFLVGAGRVGDGSAGLSTCMDTGCRRGWAGRVQPGLVRGWASLSAAGWLMILNTIPAVQSFILQWGGVDTCFEADGQAAGGKCLLPLKSPLPRRELDKDLKYTVIFIHHISAAWRW